ncbi:MAG: hypothetical protein LBC03_07355 [Nitrososphaerota archaeon]|nr:hypothetical protein [Nitrososphaerota archaeon]
MKKDNREQSKREQHYFQDEVYLLTSDHDFKWKNPQFLGNLTSMCNLVVTPKLSAHQ